MQRRCCWGQLAAARHLPVAVLLQRLGASLLTGLTPFGPLPPCPVVDAGQPVCPHGPLHRHRPQPQLRLPRPSDRRAQCGAGDCHEPRVSLEGWVGLGWVFMAWRWTGGWAGGCGAVTGQWQPSCRQLKERASATSSAPRQRLLAAWTSLVCCPTACLPACPPTSPPCPSHDTPGCNSDGGTRRASCHCTTWLALGPRAITTIRQSAR